MNSNVKAFFYKLYLSAQTLIRVIGILVFIGLVIVSAHDVYTTDMAKDCVQSAIGTDKLVFAPSTRRWYYTAEEYIKDLKNLDKMQLEAETINGKCSEYVLIVVRPETKGVDIFIRNYLGWTPALPLEKIGFITVVVGVFALLSVLLFGLMKWFSWLFKTDNGKYENQ